MFEADNGYAIVETDMSQAEARIVALFARDERVLKLFADKADIHRLTASWIFGIKPPDVTKELRFIGKTCRHAGNYDMGKHRLMELVNTEAKRQGLDVTLSEWKAGKILDAFHNFSPNIRSVFHQEIQDALQSNSRVLVNPYGRYRQFFDRWGVQLFKEAYAQLPQSTVPDHLRRAGIRANDRFRREGIDARFVVEAHDALVGLVREKDVPAYIELLSGEIEQPIDFSRCTISRGSLVIPSESKVGYNYKTCEDKKCQGCKQLHDYKLEKAA
jgi:DNA polymerase-1